MPNVLPEEHIQTAYDAVAHAQSVRRYHRRRTGRGVQQRERDIELALARLRDAMKPLRRAIGQFPYGPTTEQAETNREAIREASTAIQKERRKLHKMKARPQPQQEDLTV